MVADKLQIDYIDREIIAKVAERLNLDEEEIIEKETPPTGLQSRIAEALARGFTVGDGIQGVYLPMWQIPLDNTRYLEALTSFITELAQGHTAVIFGRGSQYILKNHPRSLHISTVAPLHLRIQRVMESLKVTEIMAKQEIAHYDGSAREFIKRYFGAEMEDATHYDLTINTERYSFSEAASLIVEALCIKSFLSTPI